MEGITAMGEGCFAASGKLQQAYFPAKITAVPAGAYMATGITELTIPDHITAIGNDAFNACAALASVDMGASVLSVGENAFADCPALATVKVASTVPPMAAANSFDASTAAELIVPQGFEDAYNAAEGWKNFAKVGTVTIPVNPGDRFVMGHVPYQVVTFDGGSGTVKVTHHNLPGVAAPNATQVRDANQQGYQGVESLTVPATITYQDHILNVVEVCDSAFYKANNLVSVALPATATITAGNHMFEGCSKLAAVTLPTVVNAVGTYMFADCASLTGINLPDGVASIGDRAFTGCSSLASIVIPEGITALGTRTFYNCKALKSVTLPSTLTKISDYCFYANAFESIEIPAAVTTIGSAAFSDCKSLKSAALPEGLTQVHGYCFMNCSALESVTLPESVKTLGSSVFANCTALASVQLPKSVTALPESCFSGCTNLVFEIPENITSIGAYAFKDCTSLPYAVIPAGVTTFGYYDVFGNLPNLPVYSLIEAPKAARAYTFRVKTARPYTYATVNVLSGLTDTYKASSMTGWKDANIVESQVASATVGDAKVVTDGSNVTLTAPFTVEYLTAQAQAEMPAAFVKANNAWIAKAINATAKVGEDTYPGVVTLTDGVLNVTFANIPTDTELAFTLDGKRGDVTVFKEFAATPQNAVQLIDFDKIDNWAGAAESTNRAALVLRWNDAEKGNASYFAPIDNLVMGVRFGDAATVTDIIKAAAEGNRRLSVSDNLGTLGYDMTGRGAALGSFDHKKSNTDAAAWNFYKLSGDKYQLLDSKSAAVANGDVVVAEYQPVNTREASSRTGFFYLPSDDKIGIFLPEETQYFLEDNMHFFVPFYINAGEGGTYTKATATCEGYEPYISYAPSMSTMTSSSASKGNTTLRSHMNFLTGKTGSFNISITATLNGQNYTAEGVVAVMPPMRPITSITLEDATPIEITGYPNRSVKTLRATYEPADATYTKTVWSSSDAQVVSVTNAGVVNAGGKQGECVLSLSSVANPEVKAEVSAKQVLNKLVTDIEWGDGTGVFNLEYMDILLVDPKITPEDADNPGFTYEIIGDPEIATTYTTKDIINHKPGTVQVKVSAADGSGVEKIYTVNFSEPDRRPLEDNYQDGTFWLNEEWYTHTNGSINYIMADGTVKYRVYEAQNPYESFGATSQFGMIFGDRLYVMSKQPKDGGDPRPGGGRLVIIDAKTMKKLAAFDNFDDNRSDGRACVGINPEKVYVGTTGGIKVLTIDNEANTFTLADSFIEGTVGGSQYSAQLGDMVADNRYAYVVKQNTGVLVIDTETDKVVKTVPLTSAIGLARAFDGTVWVASSGKLNRIDPDNDFDYSEEYALPAAFPNSWGAWRSANLFASKTENVLYWGSASGWNAGPDRIYRWEIGTDFPTEPLFAGPYPDGRGAYATGGYDSRNNEVLVATTSGANTSARYNTYNFIDGTTGEVKRTITPKEYFWFPSMPIFPDKHQPVINLDKIHLPADGAVVEVDLSKIVIDKDHPYAHMTVNYELTPVVENEIALMAEDDTPAVSIERDGDILTLTRNRAGAHTLTLTAVSNGKRVTKNVAVVNDTQTGIDGAAVADAAIECAGHTVTCRNLDGRALTMFDMSGRAIKHISVQGDVFTFSTGVAEGVYILRADNGFTAKINIR